jgi:hypothetical protein
MVVNNEILKSLIASIEHAVADAPVEICGQLGARARLVKLDNGRVELHAEPITVEMYRH